MAFMYVPRIVAWDWMDGGWFCSILASYDGVGERHDVAPFSQQPITCAMPYQQFAYAYTSVQDNV